MLDFRLFAVKSMKFSLARFSKIQVYLRSEHIAFYQSRFYQSYSKEDIFWFDYFLT